VPPVIDAHLPRLALAYHKYLSDIASSVFSDLAGRENRFAV
jgi:hypothetical protein